MKIRDLIFQFLPTFLIFVVLLGQGYRISSDSNIKNKAYPIEKAKLIVVIVDSLDRKVARDSKVMPFLASQENDRFLLVKSCSGNFTLPCMRTLFEGKESPYGSVLFNFTGMKAGSGHFFDLLQQNGLTYAFIGDHTLPEMYGKHSKFNIDTDKLGQDYFSQDMGALKELREKFNQVDVIVAHLPGADKTAHNKNPGHPFYNKHFGAIDSWLAVWVKPLTEKYNIIVLGDHGHDENGHHDFDTISFFFGKKRPSLPKNNQKEIHQKSLFSILLSYFHIPTPVDYEGSFFLLENNQFKKNQSQFWKDQGQWQGSIEKTQKKLQEDNKSNKFWDFSSFFPFLLLYFCWLFRNPEKKPLHFLAFFAVLFLLFLFRVHLLSFIFIAGIIYLGYVKRKQFPSLITLGLAGLCSYFAADWSKFFHSHSGFKWQILLFYFLFIAIPLILILISKKSWKPFVIFCLIISLLILPSGVYYYQFGQNIFRSFLFSFLISLLLFKDLRSTFLRKDLTNLCLTALFFITAFFLDHQDVGGWVWDLHMLDFFRNNDQWIPLLLFFAFYFLFSKTLKLKLFPKLIFLTLSILYYGYSCAFAQLDLSVLGFSAVFASFIYSFEKKETSNDINYNSWIYSAFLLFFLWAIFRGFFMENIDFRFGFSMIPKMDNELIYFFCFFILSFLKYLLPILWIFWVIYCLLGEKRLFEISNNIFWILNLKALALLFQIQIGSLAEGNKVFELAKNDLVFVMGLILNLIPCYLFLLLYQKFRPPNS